MNREVAAHILRKGKSLAPDRFPSVPKDQVAAGQILDDWCKALGTVNLPWQVWPAAVVLWATERVGDRMVTPRDLIGAAYSVRDRWEGDPSKRQILNEHRLARLNANYERMGLEAVSADALPQHASQPPKAVHGAARWQSGAPERLGEINIRKEQP